MTRWVEVAEGVFQRRYEPWDVTVAVVRGAEGLLVVDTRGSHRQADEVRSHLRELGGEVRWVVNTHAHFDHTFGNARFGPGSDVGAEIYAHERVPAHLVEYEEPLLARRIAERVEPVDEWQEVVITPPTRLVGAAARLELGDRSVDLHHLGRGHTDNDLLLHVPDCDAWLVGDVLEESGPPMYGSGSFPLDWPSTVEALCDRLGDTSVVVPGHGRPVDRVFARAQHADLRAVADLIRELHAAAVPVASAVAEGGTRWPFPPAGLEKAVADGYAQLDAGL